jgi:hypothetical protein
MHNTGTPYITHLYSHPALQLPALLTSTHAQLCNSPASAHLTNTLTSQDCTPATKDEKWANTEREARKIEILGSHNNMFSSWKRKAKDKRDLSRGLAEQRSLLQ